MKKDLNNFSFLAFPLGFCLVVVLVFVWEWGFDADFSVFGIYPRSLIGLRGILLSPFIHGDYRHLVSNMSALPILMSIFTLFSRRNYFRIFVALWFSTCLLVWIFGRSSYHIGVSGIIYALASFLFFGGIISRRAGAIYVSLIMVFLYGGMVWGIFPGQPHVSWESHALGAMSGFVCAFVFVDKEGDICRTDSDWNFRFPGFSNPNVSDGYGSVKYFWKK